ncbi:MAG: hypothetical protein ABIP74_05385 [Candidatus Saccharimonas sp.]
MSSLLDSQPLTLTLTVEGKQPKKVVVKPWLVAPTHALMVAAGMIGLLVHGALRLFGRKGVMIDDGTTISFAFNADALKPAK